MALCITISILVSLTESRMRSATSVNHAFSTVFAPLPKKSTPDTGNVRKRSLIRIRPRPALVPTPTPLASLWASWKKASRPWATLPNPHPRRTQLLRNRERLPSSQTSSARTASSPLKNTSAGLNRTCVCSVAVVATRPKNARSQVLRQPRLGLRLPQPRPLCRKPNRWPPLRQKNR